MVFNAVGIDPGLEQKELSFDPKQSQSENPAPKCEADFLLEIFRKSSKSFVEFVNTWVFRGEVLDPMSEFFIKLNTSLPRDDDFWDAGMFFLKNKLPRFLKLSDAEMIFKAGKIQRLFKKLEQQGLIGRGSFQRQILERRRLEKGPGTRNVYWKRVQDHVKAQQSGQGQITKLYILLCGLVSLLLSIHARYYQVACFLVDAQSVKS